jgi:hypothetical protein
VEFGEDIRAKVRFSGEERQYAPDVCEFWQRGRIPRPPYQPKVKFVRWLSSDSEENYYKEGNRSFSVESVGYEFNSLGYRGPEFDALAGDRPVMFVGDSNTFGIGTPWDDLWTSCVTRYLQDKWGAPVRQVNLGWAGTGSDYVAMVVHQSVEALRPRAIFVLWSWFTRVSWFPTPRRWQPFLPHFCPGEFAKEHAAYLRLATDAQAFFNFVRNFHFVSERLLRLGIPYYWGTLEATSPEMLQWYLPLDGYVGRWTELDRARDGKHGGVQSHAQFASRVVAAIERT